MQNLSKIDTAKDLVTKEWVEAQDFLPSSAFTQPGIKNALGISDWALAASKPSYKFSEIGSKPTTLSGYGITDAVRNDNSITPTASPNVLGYGGGEGWPVGGPVMVWGSGSYIARLCVDIWETNPTMLISCLAGDAATEWATFVTSLNVTKYAMKVDSGVLNGVDLNEMIAPGAYNTWGTISNKPSTNEATILVISSKNNYLTSQILTDYYGHIYSRMNVDGTWTSWHTILDDSNIGDYAMSKAGGTISGALIVNSTLTTSGSIFCYSNIKISAGGQLILGNEDGITSWSDLKSKINAVRQENSITPTASPNVMGYAGGGEGWPVGGPVMVWGSGSYVARLCVNIWETNPTMLISCLAGADATEWATFVTSLNVGQYAMKVDSGILSGANLNELMTPGSYNNWAGVSNSPTSAESTILVISSKTNYLTSQILINAQGHLYSRMNEGGTWKDWRTILDTDNIGTTSLPSINLNGETINSWDEVRHGWTYRITASWNADINVKRYEHIGISGTLTASSSPVTFNIENVSPVSSVVVFRTGNTLPTVKFKYGGTEGAIKWEDGIDITQNLSVNTGYRIEFDGNFAMVRMFK